MGDANPRVRMHNLIKTWHEKGVTTPEGAGSDAPAQLGSERAAKLNEKISKITAEDI